MSVRVSPFNPKLLDFVTWVITKGCCLFQRIHITPKGLLVKENIPELDFVALVPVDATLSMLDAVKDITFPLKISPDNYSNKVAFAEDLTHGAFTFIAFLAKILLTGNPHGVKAYLDILPCSDEVYQDKLISQMQSTKSYQELTHPLLTHCQICRSDFDAAFKRSFYLYQRYTIPFWVSNGKSKTGHPHFQASPFAQTELGNIMGMVPIFDLALHSTDPNTSIGYPDQEMISLLSQRSKANIRSAEDYFVMQALRNIEKGETITIDKNVHFNWDDETFRSCFGFLNQSQVETESIKQRNNIY